MRSQLWRWSKREQGFAQFPHRGGRLTHEVRVAGGAAVAPRVPEGSTLDTPAGGTNLARGLPSMREFSYPRRDSMETKDVSSKGNPDASLAEKANAKAADPAVKAAARGPY